VRHSTAKNYYDVFDAVYRDSWGLALHHGWFDEQSGDRRLPAALQRFQSQVIARLEPGLAGSPLSLCDVGCGYGAFSAALLQHSLITEATAITNSQAQVDVARRLLPSLDRLQLQQSDWLQNGLPDATFDRLIAIESLYHFQGDCQRRAVDEIARVLRSDGRAVVTLWLAREDSGWCRSIEAGMCVWSDSFGSLATELQFRECFAASGLRVVSFDDVSGNVRATLPLLFRRVLATLREEPAAFTSVLSSPFQAIRAGVAFAATWLGYATGALRYAIVVLEKP
jgi:tocopherol O-methyltransferase